MRIVFTKDGGNPVHVVLAASKDHWDACLIGHQMLEDGSAGDADDFIVTPITNTENIHAEVVDVSVTSPLEWRCAF